MANRDRESASRYIVFSNVRGKCRCCLMLFLIPNAKIDMIISRIGHETVEIKRWVRFALVSQNCNFALSGTACKSVHFTATLQITYHFKFGVCHIAINVINTRFAESITFRVVHVANTVSAICCWIWLFWATNYGKTVLSHNTEQYIFGTLMLLIPSRDNRYKYLTNLEIRWYLREEKGKRENTYQSLPVPETVSAWTGTLWNSTCFRLEW